MFKDIGKWIVLSIILPFGLVSSAFCEESKYRETDKVKAFLVYQDHFEEKINKSDKYNSIAIQVKDFNIYVPIKSEIKFKKPLFGKEYLVFPKDEFWGIVVEDEKTNDFKSFDKCSTISGPDETECRATSEEGVASIYINSEGKITHVAAVLNKVPGGMDRLKQEKKDANN